MNVILHDRKDNCYIPDKYHVISDDNTIKHCIGCFGCWIKTPGVCVLKDNYNDMGSVLAQTEKLIIISECIYGSYSPFIRNVLDRSISYLLPFFQKTYNETHHKPRYKNKISLEVHFYGNISEKERLTANNLVIANAKNLYTEDNKVLFHPATFNIEEVLL